MREIKFRAWHKEKARYYEVDEIYFSMQRLAIKGYEEIYEKEVLYVVDLDQVILEQYTGLKDKNGVDIYECVYFESY